VYRNPSTGTSNSALGYLVTLATASPTEWDLPFTPMGRESFVATLAEEAADPDRNLEQGDSGTCAIADAANAMFVQNAAQGIAVGADLALKGSAKLPGSKNINVQREYLHLRPTDSRSLSDMVIGEALADLAVELNAPQMDYDASRLQNLGFSEEQSAKLYAQIFGTPYFGRSTFMFTYSPETVALNKVKDPKLAAFMMEQNVQKNILNSAIYNVLKNYSAEAPIELSVVLRIGDDWIGHALRFVKLEETSRGIFVMARNPWGSVNQRTKNVYETAGLPVSRGDLGVIRLPLSRISGFVVPSELVEINPGLTAGV